MIILEKLVELVFLIMKVLGCNICGKFSHRERGLNVESAVFTPSS